MRIKIIIANKIRDVKRGGGRGGGLAPSVTMTLIFPKIVWTCSLNLLVIFFIHSICKLYTLQGRTDSAGRDQIC